MLIFIFDNEVRNFPALNQTSLLSPHLRFGTVSIRRIVENIYTNESFLSELIWGELNTTGYMHNRVRMIVASFLCKHLLIDWRWGEAYFASKLLDYELSSNIGNWQWAAGTGCDAAPYFRIFNPTEQVRKFDPDRIYIKKWIPELDSLNYPAPIVELKKARERAIEAYKKGIQLYRTNLN